jgi:hypothetical protein
MSKRAERREAERAARKLAYQLSRQQPLQSRLQPVDRKPSPAAAALAQTVAASPADTVSEATTENETDLLSRAQAFFNHPPAPAAATSAAQIEANRANAQHSTGPVSAAGKAASARNNTRHGLTAASEADTFRVLGNESQSDYDHDLTAFRAEWQPETATERDLVNRIVMHQWLRRRALRLQETLFSLETGEVTDFKKFELYRRYETAHERGFNKAFSDLMRLRSFQLRQRNGFESQQRKNEEHEFKMQRLKNREELKHAAQNAKAARKNRAPLSKAA